MPYFILYLLPCIILGSVYALYKLWVIDMRIRILPNIYVLLFAVSGLAFHICTSLRYEDAYGMTTGAALGSGLLYFIRFVANWHYGRDTLGLGDVKLMAAGGLWLGAEDTLMALSIGAIAGLLHGFTDAFIQRHRNGQWPDFAVLEIPAGPGFITGIVIVALVKFSDLPHLFIHG